MFGEGQLGFWDVAHLVFWIDPYYLEVTYENNDSWIDRCLKYTGKN